MSEPDKYNSEHEESFPDEVAASLEKLTQGDVTVLKEVWHIVGIAKPDIPETPHLQEAMGQFRSAIQRESRMRERPDRKSMRPQRWNTVLKWKSAVVLIFLGVCLMWIGTRSVEFVAPNGITKTISLSDGSTVVLQGGSRLVKRRWMWEWSRGVMLTGEAFFDVVSGKKPFTVHTTNANITVLGTSFNVAVWPSGSDAQTVLHVKTGTVLFSSNNTSSPGDTLYAGQMSRLMGTGGEVSEPTTFNPDIELLWLDGGIAFLDRPLAEVISVLARRLDVEIKIEPSVNDKELISWIQPKLGDVEAALTDICNVAGCSFQRMGDIYNVK